MEIDQLSHKVIGCAIEVHRHLGPGLLESAYERCLAHELSLQNIPFIAQHPVPVVYKGAELDCAYRLDFLIEDRLVVELKAIECLLPIHEAQLLTYMKLAKQRIGLLINFNVPILKDGLKRLVL